MESIGKNENQRSRWPEFKHQFSSCESVLSVASLNLSKKIALKIKIQQKTWFSHSIMTNLWELIRWLNVKNIQIDIMIITHRHLPVGCWSIWFGTLSFLWRWRTRILSSCVSSSTSWSSILSISLKELCWTRLTLCWHRWRRWCDLRGFRLCLQLWF